MWLFQIYKFIIVFQQSPLNICEKQLNNSLFLSCVAIDPCSNVSCFFVLMFSLFISFLFLEVCGCRVNVIYHLIVGIPTALKAHTPVR